MDSISSHYVFWHMQLYVLIHHNIFRLYLYFLNIFLYFFKYSCDNIFHRRSLYISTKTKTDNATLVHNTMGRTMCTDVQWILCNLSNHNIAKSILRFLLLPSLLKWCYFLMSTLTQFINIPHCANNVYIGPLNRPANSRWHAISYIYIVFRPHHRGYLCTHHIINVTGCHLSMKMQWQWQWPDIYWQSVYQS